MAVGARVILSPHGIAVLPVAAAAEATGVEAARIRILRIHQAGELPFGLVVGVGGEREIVVFDARVLAEGLLEGEERAHQRRRSPDRQQRPRDAVHQGPSASYHLSGSLPAARQSGAR